MESGAIISSNIPLPLTFHLSSHSRIPHWMNCLWLLVALRVLFILFILLFFYSSERIISFVLSSILLLFLLSVTIYYWALLVKFSFHFFLFNSRISIFLRMLISLFNYIFGEILSQTSHRNSNMIHLVIWIYSNYLILSKLLVIPISYSLRINFYWILLFLFVCHDLTIICGCLSLFI